MSWFLSWLPWGKVVFSYWALNPRLQGIIMSWFSSWPLCDKVVFLLSHDIQAPRNHNVLIPLFRSLCDKIHFFLSSPDTQAPTKHKVLIPILTIPWHSSFSWMRTAPLLNIHPGGGSSWYRMFIHSLTLWDHRRELLVTHIGFHQTPHSEP